MKIIQYPEEYPEELSCQLLAPDHDENWPQALALVFCSTFFIFRIATMAEYRDRHQNGVCQPAEAFDSVGSKESIIVGPSLCAGPGVVNFVNI
jgi:hypothetical protein